VNFGGASYIEEDWAFTKTDPDADIFEPAQISRAMFLGDALLLEAGLDEATVTLTSPAGAFDLFSLDYIAGFSLGMASYNVTSNLGHATKVPESSSGTLNLNWFGVSTVTFFVGAGGDSGVVGQFTLDNIVVQLPEPGPALSGIGALALFSVFRRRRAFH
jgi:hypothetical protein